jgi:hypothetical protein
MAEKWWSRRNIGVGEMVESEKHWSRRNGGVGEMVEHDQEVGCSTMVAVKLVDYSIVIY